MTQMCFFNQCTDFTLRDFLFEAVKFNKYAGTAKVNVGTVVKYLIWHKIKFFIAKW